MDLSDNNDDFESFFNTKKSKSSIQTKLSKVTDPIEDLFGLDEKTERKSYIAISKDSKSEAGAREKVDNDDDLGFDPRKPKALGKPQNLFDDLLGPLDAKRPQTSVASNARTALSRQSTDTTTDNSNIIVYQAARPKTSQGRRTSNLSSVQNPDPLSLFTSKPTSLVTSPKVQKRDTTADWLGLSKEHESEITKDKINLENRKTLKSTQNSDKEFIETLKIAESNDSPAENNNQLQREQPEQQNDEGHQTNNQYMTDMTRQSIMLMNTLDLETQQGISTLKYQEQQLMIASQMKQQERVLMDMERKQDSLLQQQERQFQNLFQQQMQRHQKLEDLIKQQQQRINNHLQLMMTQPPLSQNLLEVNAENSSQGKVVNIEQNVEAATTPLEDKNTEKQTALELIQFESDNKRLELENLRLEELIANTKSNYEREIELLERSYKKQIEVLDDHLSSVEKRLKSELSELQIYFQNKITVLEQEKNTLKKNYEEELYNLKQDHDDDLRKLRKNQEEDLEMLKEEHRRMLDNIRQAKMLEFAVLQENGSYLDCLKVASNNLQDLSGGLQDLKENMQYKIEIVNLEKEKYIEQREKKVADRERRLTIIEQSNELEKQRLMDLVSNLELQMTKMSKDSAEENWQLRQKMASIDAEKLAFNKEKEFVREQILRDEERIKNLKEQQLMETQTLQVQLQDERTQFQAEKFKFELEKRLQNNTGIQKEHLEVEAAMQVAQDATRKADLERERFYKMQRQLELQKRDLSDKEHVLNVREDEMHQELLSYRMAEKVAQESQQKAKIAEQFYQNKLHLLQQRSNEILEREANLSQERLLLAQDRIAVHALKTKFSKQPKCTLCQLSQKNQEITSTLNGPPSNIATNKKEFSNSQGTYDFLSPANIVERMLDANIADSLRKMHSNSNLVAEWENLLDDDHKKMVQNDECDIADIKHISHTNL